MIFTQYSCQDFVTTLAGSDPVPGGGGASALAGAIGTALGNMVGSLTLGKKKYADVQEDIRTLKARADALQDELLGLVQRDAEAFAPLARAYGLPTDTGEQRAHKQEVMEAALSGACDVPLRIMEACGEAIALHHAFAQKGSTLAISDVGVGVALCEAALRGASLNVFINTKAMTDRERAERLNHYADELLSRHTALAKEIFEDVCRRLR